MLFKNLFTIVTKSLPRNKNRGHAIKSNFSLVLVSYLKGFTVACLEFLDYFIIFENSCLIRPVGSYT